MRTRLFVAFALLVTACSGSSADTTSSTTTTIEPTTTESSTTTTEPTTTTTVDDRPRSPINGLPLDDEELLDRRVLAIKVDNHWNARPQAGILEADAVFEILVEGGLTRFMTVFHSSDAAVVGPIRSGRPSDAAIIRPLDATLAISGGQPWIRSGIEEVGVPYISDSRPGMFRVGFRFAPHNLSGNTLELRDVADEREYPDDPPTTGLWEFGELPTDAEEASEVTFVFSTTTTTHWSWDGETYWRSIDDEPSSWVPLPEGTTPPPSADDEDDEGSTDTSADDTDTTGTTDTTLSVDDLADPDDEVGAEPERISADVLVAIVGRQYVASPPSGSGSAVPATETTGSGPVYVFAGGKVVEGTWERETAADPFTLTTADGDELLVPPGHPWISIVPDQGEVSFEDTPVTTTTTTEPTDG